MNAFLARHKDAIEAFVNSPEAVAFVDDTFDSGSLRTALETRLDEPLPDDLWDLIETDLYDWWKNGNFVVWDEGETDAFGVGRWTIDNDPYFAAQYDELT